MKIEKSYQSTSFVLLLSCTLSMFAFSLKADDIRAKSYEKAWENDREISSRLHEAVRNGKKDDPREKYLIEAVKENKMEEVRKLIEAGVSADTVQKTEERRQEPTRYSYMAYTPTIHDAICNDNIEMVQYLIEHGADVNRETMSKRDDMIEYLRTATPLCHALGHGYQKIAILLIRNGADVEKGRYSRTWDRGLGKTESPLEIAREKKLQEVIDLIQQKLDEIKTNQNEETETHE